MLTVAGRMVPAALSPRAPRHALARRRARARRHRDRLGLGACCDAAARRGVYVVGARRWTAASRRAARFKPAPAAARAATHRPHTAARPPAPLPCRERRAAPAAWIPEVGPWQPTAAGCPLAARCPASPTLAAFGRAGQDECGGVPSSADAAAANTARRAATRGAGGAAARPTRRLGGECRSLLPQPPGARAPRPELPCALLKRGAPPPPRPQWRHTLVPAATRRLRRHSRPAAFPPRRYAPPASRCSRGIGRRATRSARAITLAPAPRAAPEPAGYTTHPDPNQVTPRATLRTASRVGSSRAARST